MLSHKFILEAVQERQNLLQSQCPSIANVKERDMHACCEQTNKQVAFKHVLFLFFVVLVVFWGVFVCLFQFVYEMWKYVRKMEATETGTL